MRASTGSRRRPPDHLLSLKEAEDLLQPVKPLLEECIRHGWDAWSADYKHKQHVLSPRSRAAIVFDEIVFHAEQNFSGMSGINFERRHNSFLLYIGSDAVIRFKKIRKNGKCSSIDTRQQVLFKLQMLQPLQMSLPGMGESTMLHAGYALDDLQQNIVRKSVVCQWANRVLWTIDLFTDAAASIAPMPALPVQPQVPQPQVPRFEAKLEAGERKEKKKRAKEA